MPPSYCRHLPAAPLIHGRITQSRQRSTSPLLVITTGILAIVFLLLVALRSGEARWPEPSGFDAGRLRTGHFVYRTTNHGETVGEGHVRIRRTLPSENYVFS